jgi:membrane-associated protease RseP (regulator of RpoE activity)
MYRKKNPLYIHILLFFGTFLTTTIAGVQWVGKDFTHLENLSYGLTYGFLMITFLTSHEFGHYIASRIHKVDATLPYYIPFPPAPGLMGLFGTFGAVIKTRSPILSRKALFDIGVAGPISGFIVSIIFLIYGFLTLPDISYILNIHPEYIVLYGGEIPRSGLHFGDNLGYYLLSKIFVITEANLPPMNEMYHYPFLNAGWFGLFVTALNIMMPMGQLDGGHVTYAMFGPVIQKKIAKVFWIIIMSVGALGTLGYVHEILSYNEEGNIFNFFKTILYPPLDWIKTNIPYLLEGWGGWLFWGLIIRFFIKLPHPPVQENDKLDKKRMIIGWISLIILILSISYNGIYFVNK